MKGVNSYARYCVASRALFCRCQIGTKKRVPRCIFYVHCYSNQSYLYMKSLRGKLGKEKGLKKSRRVLLKLAGSVGIVHLMLVLNEGRVGTVVLLTTNYGGGKLLAVRISCHG